MMEILVRALFIALAAFAHFFESSEGSSRGNPRSPPQERAFVKSGDNVLSGLFYEDQSGNLEPLPDEPALYALDNYLIGLVLRHTWVVPLFDRHHDVVWQNRLNPADHLVVDRAWARQYGMPGSVEEVGAAIDRNNEMFTAMARQAAERARQQSSGRARQQSAGNEPKRSRGN